MQLVLASQGFTTSDIGTAVAELVGKPLRALNIAIINEAYVGIDEGQDETWLVGELSLITKYMKGTVSFVNLRAYDMPEIERRLKFADVIYIVGGAQLVLPQLFRESGFDELLMKLASSKVIMGTSAGANVLGKQIESQTYWQDQYGASEAYLSNPFLGLVDFNILPHFERADHPRRTAKIVLPLLRDNPFPLFGVTDSQAVIYDDGAIRFVGGTPVTFGGRA